MTDLTTWEQRVAAWRASGQSARAFAEGQEFSVHMLRYWSRRVGARASARGTAARSEVRLARVERVPSATGPTIPPAPMVIEVGAARIQVAPGVDRSTLATVLEVLARTGR
jgi:hypothetical protein